MSRDSEIVLILTVNYRPIICSISSVVHLQNDKIILMITKIGSKAQGYHDNKWEGS